MSNKYLAITIGPIYKTMSLARTTREFWGASILISILSQQLCKSLLRAGVKTDDFLVPNKSILHFDIMNIGLFMDRIVCTCDEKIFAEFEKSIIQPSLENVLEEIKDIPTTSLTYEELKNYFKIFAVYKMADEATPLESLSNDLNTLELYNKASSESNFDNKFRNLLENVNSEYLNDDEVKKNSFLERYFDIKDYNKNIRIPSIVEIGTVELSKHNKLIYKKILNKTLWKPKPEEKPIFPEFKREYGDELKNYHKYYCIIQADGDKLGKMLMLSNANKVDEISNDLITWGKQALGTLKKYDALPIYIGGDDLLSFAPVNNGDQTILDLLFELNRSYTTMPNLQGKSTLSISVKISYHKATMYESYKETFALLKTAKKTGNAACIKLDKHSGQPHEFTFSFTEEYKKFVCPLTDSMINEKSFLNSVIYEINKNEKIIFEIRKNPERLWYFFENNFEEARPKKKDTEKYKFLKAISNYLFYLFGFAENEELEKTSKKYIATIKLYSTLKTIRFIKGLDDDK